MGKKTTAEKGKGKVKDKKPTPPASPKTPPQVESPKKPPLVETLVPSSPNCLPAKVSKEPPLTPTKRLSPKVKASPIARAPSSFQQKPLEVKGVLLGMEEVALVFALWVTKPGKETAGFIYAVHQVMKDPSYRLGELDLEIIPNITRRATPESNIPMSNGSGNYPFMVAAITVLPEDNPKWMDPAFRQKVGETFASESNRIGKIKHTYVTRYMFMVDMTPPDHTLLPVCSFFTDEVTLLLLDDVFGKYSREEQAECLVAPFFGDREDGADLILTRSAKDD